VVNLSMVSGAIRHTAGAGLSGRPKFPLLKSRFSSNAMTSSSERLSKGDSVYGRMCNVSDFTDSK
jgi:hypothetical protein